jgi:hypothetical protein
VLTATAVVEVAGGEARTVVDGADRFVAARNLLTVL